MILRRLSLILPAVLALSLSVASPGEGSFKMPSSQNSQMAYERDVFLMSLPDGLQESQRRSIRRSLRGDMSGLMKLRASRNPDFSPSENVEVTEMSLGYEDFVEAPGGIKARLYKPKEMHTDKPLPLLVYFHGGGWVFGSLNSCAAFCDALVAGGEAMILAVDYRLAPENVFPRQIEDCIAATYYAIRHSEEWGSSMEKVSVGGDSAGGNLAIMTALALNDSASKSEVLRPLESVIAIYPVVKTYADGSASWKDYGACYGLDADLMETFNQAYLCGTEKTDDHLRENLELQSSPYDMPDEVLERLPRTLILSAGKDILYCQGEEFAKKIKRLGVDAEQVVFENACHLFITVPGQRLAFKEAVKVVSAFLNDK